MKAHGIRQLPALRHGVCAARAGISIGLLAALVGGCVVAPAPVIVTPAEQASRLVFTCPNAKTVEVTRAQGGQLAIVVVDGRTLQLPRVADASTERYSNRLQTLTIFGNSATLETLGQTAYGPCVSAYADSSGEGPGRRPRDRDRD